MAKVFWFKNVLVLMLGLAIGGLANASDITSLRCDFYPIESDNDFTPNVRFTRGWLGFGGQRVEVDPERDGSWKEAATIEANDSQISYKDGWGLKNTKDCEIPRFNVLDHCPTVKIIEKEVARDLNNEMDVVITKQWFEKDCCYKQRQFSAGDLATRGSCILIKVAD